MSNPPVWARNLVMKVAQDEGLVCPPELTWREYQHISSCGSTWPNRVIVTAGSAVIDQKMVLLHELAHWLTLGEHHSTIFWDKAWKLYRRYKVPIRHCKEREFGYRKGAQKAYHRSVKNKYSS